MNGVVLEGSAGDSTSLSSDTYMVLEVGTGDAVELSQSVVQPDPLSEQVLELDRSQPRPLNFWQLGPGRNVLVQQRQLVHDLLADRLVLPVDDPSGIGLASAAA